MRVWMGVGCAARSGPRGLLVSWWVGLTGGCTLGVGVERGRLVVR